MHVYCTTHHLVSCQDNTTSAAPTILRTHHQLHNAA